MQEFQSIQIQFEGRLKEHERRVAQGEWLRSSRCSTWSKKSYLQEHQVLLQAGEEEKEFMNSQMQSELQSHNEK